MKSPMIKRVINMLRMSFAFAGGCLVGSSLYPIIRGGELHQPLLLIGIGALAIWLLLAVLDYFRVKREKGKVNFWKDM